MTFLETIEFPTDLIEQEWARVRIFEDANGRTVAVLVHPSVRHISPEHAVRLTEIAIQLWTERKGLKNDVTI